MATQISNSFITQYEREVHNVFQKRGAILPPTVRTVNGVVGSSTTFQKIGKGTATTKARHGAITPMNQTHTAVSCTISDLYAGDWVDKLDESKININERMALAEGGAWALGRAADDQILTAMDGTSQSTVTMTVTSEAAIRNSLLSLVQALDANDVQNDGRRYAALSTMGWAFAMTAQEFTNSQWVGADGLPFNSGAPVNRFKDYLGVKWTVHTGISGSGTATAKQFAWHMSAVGFATGAHAGNIAANQAVSADITWHGDRQAHFVAHVMSSGACLIDDSGVIEFDVDDTASLPTS